MAKSPRRMVRRTVQLLLGFLLMGFAIALVVRSALGASPWDVLTQGLTHHLPLSFGVITVLIGAVVLLSWIPLRQKPGIGTLGNMLLIGPAADLAFLVIPSVQTLWVQIVYLAVGIFIGGFATGLYIGARFGPGPRDGLMTGLHRVTGWPIWAVRTGIEAMALLSGWLLGGIVGLGTIAFALLIGPICQYFMRIFYVILPEDSREV